MGRYLLGPAWQPGYNLDFGHSLALEADTDIQKAINGTEYFNRKKPFRVANLNWGTLSETEAMQSVFELQRISGIDKEVIYIYDPSDTYNKLRRSFIGRIRQFGEIEHPNVAQYSAAFEIKETL